MRASIPLYDSIAVDIFSTSIIILSLKFYQGTIPGSGAIELETVISSDRPAVNQKCVFTVELENCDPLAFQIAATFIGPKLKVKQAVINYGLVKTNVQSSFQLEIENTSDIPAEILLRRQGDEVTFDGLCIHFAVELT